MWDTINYVIKSIGIWGGLFVTLLIFMHWWIYKLYEGRLTDRQQEIDKLAVENREYRERFYKLIDDKMSSLEGNER